MKVHGAFGKDTEVSQESVEVLQRDLCVRTLGLQKSLFTVAV